MRSGAVLLCAGHTLAGHLTFDPNASIGQIEIQTTLQDVRFEARSAWTPDRFLFRPTAGAAYHPWVTPTGFMGTVISCGNGTYCPGNGTHWNGTGHGGEAVFSVAASADGGAARTIFPGGASFELNGTAFSVVKESQLGPIRSRQNVTVTADEVMQRSDYEVVANASAVAFMYAFMTMFSVNFTAWCAGTSLDGPPAFTGTFLHDTSFTLHADIRWALLYDPSTLTGSLYEFPETYASLHSKGNFWWNREYDNKLYFQVQVPPQPGSRFGFALRQRAYAADASSWESVGRQLLRG